MTNETAQPRRRLGVYSLGFLWQPKLRRALEQAGWAVVAGPQGADAVGVWGRRGVASRGISAAHRLNKPLITLEDGFLRSVLPGGTPPVISLIIDDLGVYYDCRTPSRLEHLIVSGCGDADAGRAGIDRLRTARLSKYNHAPDMSDPPKDHVLVIDQAHGDASITWGGADEGAFARMLDAAKAEHPQAEIIIKTHPEVLSGGKRGHLTNDQSAVVRNVSEAVNPWDLIEGAKAVYTVSSQMGFEALIAGKQVRCFGAPFYAGWGATDDEVAVPRREEKRSAAEIFAAAYLEYPTYFDPWRGNVIDFDAACDALDVLKTDHDRNRPPAVCSGVRLWKRKYVAGFLQGPGGPPRFFDKAKKAKAARKPDGRHIVWASTGGGDGDVRVEDGFLRSAGLGAELTPPLSLTFDDLGIYYDPDKPSRLERLINEASETEQRRRRASALAKEIVALGVTKYNLRGASIQKPNHTQVILAPGQVEDDASILKAAGKVRTNLGMLKAIRQNAPNAHIIYKPHPDVEAGLRPGDVNDADLNTYADQVATGVDAAAILDIADEVWTMTSLMGFEALMRGKPVTCLGVPFYAGWGLTKDLAITPARRVARPSLEALIHAVLIDYAVYRDPISKLPCTAEVIVERLANGDGRAGAGGRLLAKGQGIAASYAWLWR